MNLLSGLEKFGVTEVNNLFDDDKVEPKKEEGNVEEAAAPEEKKVQETDFLLEKAIRCPVCDGVFKTTMIKTGRLKRLEPDADLRPRYQGLDSLKYDVSMCPKCGYTALNNNFAHLSTAQIKLIQEGVCKKVNVREMEIPNGLTVFDYDQAIERTKLSLFNTIVKHGTNSEKAYTCLKISWLIRGKIEQVEVETSEDQAVVDAWKKEEDEFYRQAYDGMMKAVASEMFPICGMDQTTVDYLLASMSLRLEEYTTASKLVAGILTSRTASSRIKNKAHEMKDQIIAAVKADALKNK